MNKLGDLKKEIIRFLLPLFLFVPFVSCTNEDEGLESNITLEDLPTQAQNFLYRYFHEYAFVKGQKDVVEDMVIYQVELEEGYRVDFNYNGLWTQVQAPYGKAIPTGFIPAPILQTLDYQYHGYGITQINSVGQNYKVTLTNNQGGDSISLTFNQSGEILTQ